MSDFDFGSDDPFEGLDFGDDDFDNPSDNSGSRSPVSEAATSALDTVTSKENAGKYAGIVARNSLPNGYSAVFDTADNLASEAGSIYDSVSSELEKPINDLKKTIHSNIDAIPDIFGSSIKERIKRLTETTDLSSSGVPSQQSYDEMNISDTLAGIFEKQASAGVAAGEVSANIAEASLELQGKGLETTSGILNNISNSLTRMVTYQDSILVGFQRKSLEIMQRQFFMQRDMVTQSKAASKDTHTLLEAVVKNTGLPEATKIRMSEELPQAAIRSVYGDIIESYSDHQSNFMSSVVGNVRKKATELTASIKGGIETANMSAGALSGMGGGDPDEPSMAASMGGSIAGDGVASFFSRHIGRRLKKVFEKHPALANNSAELIYISENFPSVFNKWLNTNTQDDDPKTMFARLKNMVNSDGVKAAARSVTPRFSVDAERSIGGKSLASGNNAAVLDDNLYDAHTITVPGLLSRILQQVTEINTGQDADRIIYSREQGGFEKLGDASKRVNERLVKAEKRRKDEVLDTILKDYYGANKLSEEAKDELLGKMIADVSRGETFDPANYVNADRFSDKNGKAIAKVMDSPIQFNTATDTATGEFIHEEDRRAKIRSARVFKDLISSNPEIDKEIRERQSAGEVDVLRAAGIRFKNVGGEMQDLDDTPNVRVNRPIPNNAPSVAPTSVMAPPTPSEVEAFDEVGAIMISDALEPMFGSLMQNHTMERNGVLGVPVHVLGGTGEQTERTIGDEPEGALWLRLYNHLDVINESINSMSVTVNLGDGSGEASASASIRDRMMGVLGKGKGMLSNYYSGLGNFAGVGMGMGKNILSSAKRMMMGGFSKAKDLMDEDFDWKLPGRSFISISSAKLKAGEYFDSETQKVITKLSDVKGDILDSLGRVVVSAEELKEGLVSQDARRTSAGWFKGLSVKGAIAGVMGIHGKLLSSAVSKGKAFAKKAGDLLLGVREVVTDVRVSGTNRIALRAELMKAGEYISATTGKVIKKLSDIDGPVLNKDGIEVLSIDDFQKGLLDQFGNAIDLKALKLRGRGLMEAASGLLGKGYGAVKGLAAAGLDLAKGFGRGVRDMGVAGLGALRAKTGDNAGGDTLEKIYAHMVAKWPIDEKDALDNPEMMASILAAQTETLEELRARRSDANGDGVKDSLDQDGDGDRDNGYKDLFSRSKEKLKARAEKAKATAERLAGIRSSNKETRDEKGNIIVNAVTAMSGVIGTILTGIAGTLTGILGAIVAGKLFKRGNGAPNVGTGVGGSSSNAARSGVQGTTTGGGSGGGRFGKVLKAGKWVAGAGLGLVGIDMAMGGTTPSSGAPVSGPNSAPVSGGTNSSTAGGGRMARLRERTEAIRARAANAANGTVNATNAARSSVQGAAQSAKRSIAKKVAVGVAVGAATVLAAPVVATAATAAGVGLLGMDAWKAVRYGIDRQQLEPIETIRYLQYGVDLVDKELIAAVRWMERDMIDEISISDGKAKLNMSTRDAIEKYAEYFYVDMKSEAQQRNWAMWWAKRFVPVFTTHAIAINRIDQGIDLTDIDDEIDDDDILTFLGEVTFTEEYLKRVPFYSVTESPMPGHILSSTDLHATEALEVLKLKHTKGNSPEVRRKIEDYNEKVADKKAKHAKELVAKATTSDSQHGNLKALKRKKLSARELASLPASIRRKIEAQAKAEAAGTTANTTVTKTAAKATKKSRNVFKTAELPDKERTKAVSGKYIMPAKGRISSGFGMRMHPTKHKRSMHKGIDIAGPIGTPVYAVADGYIMRKYPSSTYGNVIYIAHDDGKQSRYAHLNNFANVRSGSQVTQGQLIGYMGNTGIGTGSHLHWEVRLGHEQESTPIDPLTTVDSKFFKAVKKEEKDVKKSLKEEEVSAKKAVDSLAKTGESVSIEGQNTIGAEAKVAAEKRSRGRMPDTNPVSNGEDGVGGPDLDGAEANRVAAAEKAKSKVRMDRLTARRSAEANRIMEERYTETHLYQMTSLDQRKMMIESLDSIHTAIRGLNLGTAAKTSTPAARSAPQQQEQIKPVVNTGHKKY